MDRPGAPERYEQLIAFLGSNLPAPVERQEDVDGSIRFTGGDPPEVVVVLTQSSVLVSEFAGEWETPFKFAARPRHDRQLASRRRLQRRTEGSGSRIQAARAGKNHPQSRRQ